MVRKQTWILLGIFALLLAAAFYLQKNPIVGGTAVTPTPTPPVNLLEGWKSSDIVWMQYQNGQEETIELSKNEQGGWTLGPEGAEPVEAGKAEQIRTQIAAIRVMANLDPGYDLASIGLEAPEKVLTIRDTQGRQAVMRFGSLTPIGNGYFVQVDQQAPSVVSKLGAEDIFNLLKKDQLLPAPVATEGADDTTNEAAP